MWMEYCFSFGLFGIRRRMERKVRGFLFVFCGIKELYLWVGVVIVWSWG